MPDYNPNSIWSSKEKKYSYDPKDSAVEPQKQPVQPQPIQPQPSPSSSNNPSFFHRHKVTIFSIVLILVVILAGVIFYLLLPPPTPNISITFTEPSSVVIGQPFPFSITVSNNSKSVLKNAQLNIALPNGISFVGQDPSVRVMPEQIDTLSSQTINPPENLQLIATGGTGAQNIAGTSQNISLKLTYQTAETAGTQYETDADTNILISQQPAIGITYNAPSSIFSGQNFDLVVNYTNDTTSTLQNAQIQMQYPPAYTFINSTVAPTPGLNNTWDIATLAPNATGTFTITGNIVGPASAQYQLNGTAIVNVMDQNYSLNPPAAANFLVATSPLSLSLLLNNSSSYNAGLNDNLNYTLAYKNNSNVTFQGLNLSVALVGQMYNIPSLQTTGAFNSNNNVIAWNGANTPQLLSLAPGQSGSVEFSITTKSAFPIRLQSDKNYTLKATAQINSPTVLPNTAGTQTASAASLSTKLRGQIAIAASVSSMASTAPQVNQAGTYTIRWDITNYSTDAQNVTVSAYLQSGTTFTEQIKSNVASSSPVYNSTTGLVTWTIPVLPATTGVISAPAEATFEVSNTPAITQIGQNVTLLGPTALSSTDAFTSGALTASADSVKTQSEVTQ